MYGKFTAQATWREVVDISQPRTGGVGGDEGGGGEVYTCRVGGPLPVIVWDAEAGKRRVVPTRLSMPS